MVIQPRIRGFVCVTAHPEGCAANVAQQIDAARAQTATAEQAARVLVIGASTGYGLSSRIAAAFGHGADTVGVFFERPSSKGKPASAGWYNAAAFEAKARESGLYAKSVNGDAFSDEVKRRTVDMIRHDLGQVDCVIYSLAAPKRVDPDTGETCKSVLKPIGETYANKTLDTDKGEVTEVVVEPATSEEIEATRKVMGGEDWERWIRALDEAEALAPGARTVAYSYLGPEVTWPIYKNGTIGKAKEDLERAATAIPENHDCAAHVSVNKAVVTQASSAIPVVPLYISMLFRVMKERGTHEGCIEQMLRLFNDRLFAPGGPPVDESGRIRLDDREMDPEVQAEVARLWPEVTTENLREATDFDGYWNEFLRLFGFGVEGVDYDADVSPERAIPSLEASG